MARYACACSRVNGFKERKREVEREGSREVERERSREVERERERV